MNLRNLLPLFRGGFQPFFYPSTTITFNGYFQLLKFVDNENKNSRLVIRSTAIISDFLTFFIFFPHLARPTSTAAWEYSQKYTDNGFRVWFKRATSIKQQVPIKEIELSIAFQYSQTHKYDDDDGLRISLKSILLSGIKISVCRLFFFFSESVYFYNIKSAKAIQRKSLLRVGLFCWGYFVISILCNFPLIINSHRLLPANCYV